MAALPLASPTLIGKWASLRSRLKTTTPRAITGFKNGRFA
jgi:hypothetical protein